MKRAFIAIGTIIIIAAAYYLLSPIWRVIEVNEEIPFEEQVPISQTEAPTEQQENEPENIEPTPAPTTIAQTDFTPADHDVSGSASIITDGTQTILRFENFETINGPNLHIYLASDTSASDYIDLGPIKGTKGNINYEIPSDVDLATYNQALVWCVPFKVLFSYADLQIND